MQHKRIKAMKYSTPLDDIFCVYSMYWRPKEHGNPEGIPRGQDPPRPLSLHAKACLLAQSSRDFVEGF